MNNAFAKRSIYSNIYIYILKGKNNSMWTKSSKKQMGSFWNIKKIGYILEKEKPF